MFVKNVFAEDIGSSYFFLGGSSWVFKKIWWNIWEKAHYLSEEEENGAKHKDETDTWNGFQFQALVYLKWRRANFLCAVSSLFSSQVTKFDSFKLC